MKRWRVASPMYTAGVCIGLIIGLMGVCILSGPTTMAEEASELGAKRAVFIVAQNGFRDEELEVPRSILERAGVKVTIASSDLSLAKGMLGAVVKPDILVGDLEVSDYNAIVLVGGIGAKEYWNDPVVQEKVRETVRTDKVLAAICIAPVTLANAGVLEGKSATVWSSEGRQLKARGATYIGEPVVIDGNIITADGPQAADRFGKAILELLKK